MRRRQLIVVGILALLGCSGPPPETENESSVPVRQTTLRAAPEQDADADDAAPSFPRGEWIDLTHSFDENTIYWPTADGFKLKKDAAGVTERGYYYSANSFAAAEHGGTHLDAPIHFFEGRQTVDEIPLRKLSGEAVVVDVSEKCGENPDYQIEVGDLRAWEEKNSR
ncbi:MAG: cyclase family protein, partial [Planctomycetales bacterium]